MAIKMLNVLFTFYHIYSTWLCLIVYMFIMVVLHCNRNNALDIIKRLKFSSAPAGFSRLPGTDPMSPPSVIAAYISLFSNDPPPESVINATHGAGLRCPPKICYNSTAGLYWWGFMGVYIDFSVAVEALVQTAL